MTEAIFKYLFENKMQTKTALLRLGRPFFFPPNGRHVNAKIVGGPVLRQTLSFAGLISLC